MKERPILMKGEMVVSTLKDKKTQTRRIAKMRSQDNKTIDVPVDAEYERIKKVIYNPYGWQGDRLWVRETHALDGSKVLYRAQYPEVKTLDPIANVRWRPSIHMPRYASRILLEIDSIKVERLQSISEEDAIAEGLSKVTKDGSIWKWGIPDYDGLPGADDVGWHWRHWERNPIDAYRFLWESIYGIGSWEVNPWVLVIGFHKLPFSSFP